MNNLPLFMRLPCPGLALRWRTLATIFGSTGLLAVGIWLQALGWPDTHRATAGIFLLPLTLPAMALEFGSAITGSLAMTAGLL